ncbi:MAG: sulfatase-like hydrolase/transferase [Bacteriovoracaceae bacterium]|jgi:glucan phosphoethanolaminetransferase (alkaline phosphatase superfamily)|nr:sulfatase-like hydrolase/transferase [Bacteriovoracaceae bacterium]
MKLWLKFCLLCVFVILSNIAFWQRTYSLLEASKWISLIAYLGLFFISLICFFITAFHPSRVLRALLGSCIFLSTVVGMTYYGVSNHYISFLDLELMWISKANTSDAILFYLDEIFFSFLVACLGLAGMLLEVRTRYQLNKTIISIFPFLPFILLSATTFAKKGYGTEGMPQQYSTASTFLLFGAYEIFSPSLVSEREQLDVFPAKNKKFNKILYIVDESIRADYLDLNYSRKLTPFLSTQEKRIANFGAIASGNNCSGYANLILRTGVSRKNLTKIGTIPLIWDYVKNAGMKAYYYDAQQTDGLLQNFMNNDEKKKIDHFIQFDGVSKSLVDHKLAQDLNTRLKSNESAFIYVNKRGAHFPYNESYPKKESFYLPQMRPFEELGASKKRLINSYKNSIRWNVDEFFKLLLHEVDLSDTLIVYTSDHGQNLMDRGVMTHCNTQTPHPYEGLVPFFVMTDNIKQLNQFKSWAKISSNKLNHFYIFPLLVDSLGYDENVLMQINENKVFVPDNALKEFSLGPLIPRFGRPIMWQSTQL